VLTGLTIRPAGAVPPGGLTGQLLKQLRMAEVAAALPPLWPEDAAARAASVPRRVGRAPVSDDRLRDVARVYLAAKGRHPSAEVARRLGIKSRGTARWLVSQARKRRFLDPARLARTVVRVTPIVAAFHVPAVRVRVTPLRARATSTRQPAPARERGSRTRRKRILQPKTRRGTPR
jgi:hypothetical protein